MISREILKSLFYGIIFTPSPLVVVLDINSCNSLFILIFIALEDQHLELASSTVKSYVKAPDRSHRCHKRFNLNGKWCCLHVCVFLCIGQDGSQGAPKEFLIKFRGFSNQRSQRHGHLHLHSWKILPEGKHKDMKEWWLHCSSHIYPHYEANSPSPAQSECSRFTAHRTGLTKPNHVLPT